MVPCWPCSPSVPRRHLLLMPAPPAVPRSCAAPCCNNPAFAEIVPPAQRNLVYAFDRWAAGHACGVGSGHWPSHRRSQHARGAPVLAWSTAPTPFCNVHPTPPTPQQPACLPLVSHPPHHVRAAALRVSEPAAGWCARAIPGQASCSPSPLAPARHVPMRPCLTSSPCPAPPPPQAPWPRFQCRWWAYWRRTGSASGAMPRSLATDQWTFATRRRWAPPCWPSPQVGCGGLCCECWLVDRMRSWRASGTSRWCLATEAAGWPPCWLPSSCNAGGDVARQAGLPPPPMRQHDRALAPTLPCPATERAHLLNATCSALDLLFPHVLGPAHQLPQVPFVIRWNAQLHSCSLTVPYRRSRA